MRCPRCSIMCNKNKAIITTSYGYIYQTKYSCSYCIFIKIIEKEPFIQKINRILPFRNNLKRVIHEEDSD